MQFVYCLGIHLIVHTHTEGNNGFLFQSNNLDDFLNKFDEFKKTDNKQLMNKKKNLKKYIKKFTLYSHFNTLNKIIKL